MGPSAAPSQRLFPIVSELQVRVDGVNATRCHRDAVDAAARESTSTCRDAVVRRRLDYIELIVWFAFEEKVFLIIFFIAGFLTILISVILWTSVRLTTMLENPPRVRIWSTLLLIVVPPFQGVLLGFIPIFVAQMSMSLLIKFLSASRDRGAASTASENV